MDELSKKHWLAVILSASLPGHAYAKTKPGFRRTTSFCTGFSTQSNSFRDPSCCRVFDVTTVALGMFAHLGWGQDARGTILGRITDEQNAVVANAPVLIENIDTGNNYIDTRVSATRAIGSKGNFLI